MIIPLIEEGLWMLLTQSAPLMATLGPHGVYMNFVPEDAPKSCLCFSTISSQPSTTFDGPSAYNVRRYQFTAYGGDYPATLRTQEALRILLDGYSGFLPAIQGQKGTMVFNIIRDLEISGYDDQGNTHRAITDYFIHFAL